jgi:hypothetical protein
MSVSDVRDIAEAQTPWIFYCLGCCVEIAVLNKWHRTRLQESVENYCSDTAGNDPPAELLCKTCQEQKNDRVEQQRRLDHERYEALLAEYRARPYAERRRQRSGPFLRTASSAEIGTAAACAVVTILSCMSTTASMRITLKRSSL